MTSTNPEHTATTPEQTTATTTPAQPTSALEMHDLSSHPDTPAVTTAEPASTPIEPSQPPQFHRSETAELALGPDGAAPSQTQLDSADPVLRITLMLTTGARHPYTISSKYLTSRKVTAVNQDGKFDPREMSAYKLKELIWTDWRPEWEPKPRDPAAIRLIILGRMLEDKSQLKDSPFSLANNNVVHMTVKPADLLDDDAEGAGKTVAKSSRGRSAGEDEGAGCCKCVVQ